MKIEKFNFFKIENKKNKTDCLKHKLTIKKIVVNKIKAIY